MKIYLIGYMGAGKSTIGKKLASRLGYKFLDLDNFIEKRKLITIDEIFEIYGHEKFRIFEREALHETFAMEEDLIISTGGGTPCYYDSIDQINKHGLSFYVRLTPGILASRISRSKTLRPLVRGKSGKKLVTFIEEQLADREEFYNKAKHTIFEPNLTSAKIVDHIHSMLENEI